MNPGYMNLSKYKSKLDTYNFILLIILHHLSKLGYTIAVEDIFLLILPANNPQISIFHYKIIPYC